MAESMSHAQSLRLRLLGLARPGRANNEWYGVANARSAFATPYHSSSECRRHEHGVVCDVKHARSACFTSHTRFIARRSRAIHVQCCVGICASRIFPHNTYYRRVPQALASDRHGKQTCAEKGGYTGEQE